MRETYQLKPGISVASFLRTVDSCRGEVLLESNAGDRLNLKSQLSKILLLAAASDAKYLKGSRIWCSSEDALLLSDYL